jgi:cytochrome c biogenesis protein CcmG/thiol:disulfide interchange protein DsbE
MTGNSVKFPRTLALAAALSLAFFGSCSRSKTSHATETGKDASNLKTAPNFTLKDSNGANVSLADYRGKVVLLNFWATWCGPCKIEIPWFMEFEQQYKNKGFEVLGVSMDDDGWEAVKPYIAEKKMNYRVVLGNDSVARDYGGIDALPTTFVINQDGKIVSSHVGLVNKDDYLKEIQNLLENRNARSIGLRRILIPALLGSRPNR